MGGRSGFFGQNVGLLWRECEAFVVEYRVLLDGNLGSVGWNVGCFRLHTSLSFISWFIMLFVIENRALLMELSALCMECRILQMKYRADLIEHGPLLEFQVLV